MTPTLAGAAARSFGDWVRQRREELRVSLRALALDSAIDAGNLSKYERGILPAPQDPEVLRRLAKALRLKDGSAELRTFVDLAAISAGRIPPDLAADPDLLKHLPVLFRTARKRRLSREDLIALAEKVRRG